MDLPKIRRADPPVWKNGVDTVWSTKNSCGSVVEKDLFETKKTQTHEGHIKDPVPGPSVRDLFGVCK